MNRLGSKSGSKIQTVGNKVMLPATIGSKLTKNILLSSRPNESTNIYNHTSNQDSVAHIPVGLKKFKK
jgi:hypothetical protein